MEAVAVVGAQMSVGRLTKPHCLLKHRVEYRCEVARRAVDDLQYLGSGGLLLQGLVRPRQKPRIFHRDDRLRREVLDQSDLLLVERPHLLTEQSDGTEQYSL